MACTHLGRVKLTELPESVAGCGGCLAIAWRFGELSVGMRTPEVEGSTRIPPSPLG